MPYTYEYPRPQLTADSVVFCHHEDALKVLLVKRKLAPFKGQWALPGGFLEMQETLEQAARRELLEETGVDVSQLKQLSAFDDPARDPRGRTISIAFMALVRHRDYELVAGSDASAVEWFDTARLPKLSFDHRKIVARARAFLEERARTDALPFELLPKKFTLTQLQRVLELLLGRELDKRNFRKKVLALAVLTELDEHEQGVAHRAARLYRFDARAYAALKREGQFEL